MHHRSESIQPGRCSNPLRNFQYQDSHFASPELKKHPFTFKNRNLYLRKSIEPMDFIGTRRGIATIVAFILVLTCVLAGGQPGFLQGSDIVTVSQFVSGVCEDSF